ncbi:PhoX family protein [Ottowia oryzae]|uniref:Alkaline phosphatase n=1 Tax=Ottowia oryzae TaxID=2109914 RepID=A0A2S0MB21_9BURK|nr:alkaline phosphatase PhoX [Ottowia oryzae]AVO33079.1 alkaline phosphatase [Ottowia oryzae]
MSQSPVASRRRVLSLFAGAPMLPLASSLSYAGLLSACGGDDTPAAAFKSVTFSATPAPTLANPAAMATTYTTSVMSVNFDDGTKKDYKLAYQPFFITGDLVTSTSGGSILAGGYVDINNQPIIDRTVSASPRQFFSDSPDGTSLLKIDGAKVPGVKGNTVFAVVQFEYTTWAKDGKTDMYGKLPSPIAVLTLDQDPDTGRLALVKYHNVDTSSVNGLWITCGASLSPWNTHLSSEEYEPDAFAERSKNNMNDFSTNLYGDATKANPYNYGHLPEVTVNADGTGSIKKHYCLGRISHELVQVMPDNRTVFMGDDATNSGYFVFVADKEKDLSSGTLYVAKVGGTTDFTKVGSPAAPLSWIKLGSATSAEIRALVDGGIRPADIMTVASKDPQDATYKRIVANGKVEWIKLKDDTAQTRKAAAFLETHRYAAYMGASMGFTKMEGTTVNIKDKKAYSALQNIQASMVAGNAVNVPDNGISVPKQLVAGGVMQLSLRGGQKDLDGNDIKSDWMPADSTPLLVGEDLLDTDGKTLKPDALGNTANPEKIANPDNLKFSETLRTLFIGEDSSQHVTNMLWAYNVDTKALTRLMTLPAGAESTGLHAVTDLNGWTYIMSNFQHAGDYTKTISADVKSAVDGLISASYHGKFGAAVGYLTGSPKAVKLVG